MAGLGEDFRALRVKKVRLFRFAFSPVHGSISGAVYDNVRLLVADDFFDFGKIGYVEKFFRKFHNFVVFLKNRNHIPREHSFRAGNDNSHNLHLIGPGLLHHFIGREERRERPRVGPPAFQLAPDEVPLLYVRVIDVGYL